MSGEESIDNVMTDNLFRADAAGPCRSALYAHHGLQQRRKHSAALLERTRKLTSESSLLSSLRLCIFAAGSLARGEAGTKSDLDLFFIAEDRPEFKSRLLQTKVFAEIIRINTELELPEFSNDGEFLHIHSLEELKLGTGSRRDDAENFFTTRMLFLLESSPLTTPELYQQYLETISKTYFRDRKGKSSFRPLFLINDLLRYWRTLCLNYEERRHTPERNWRKSNVNLKFSRMLTVFATVLPLIASPHEMVANCSEFCRRQPLERLAWSLDRLDDSRLTEKWPVILDTYERFLCWKEEENVEQVLGADGLKKQVQAAANEVSEFLFSALTHEKIPAEYRRYLVL